MVTAVCACPLAPERAARLATTTWLVYGLWLKRTLRILAKYQDNHSMAWMVKNKERVRRTAAPGAPPWE